MRADGGAERLCDAALELFGEHGYDATGVRAIAERAGVTAGLVVHHYGSKEGLRQAVDRFVLASIADAFAELQVIGPGSDHLEIRKRGFRVLFQQRPYMGRYIRRSLLEGTEASVALFDRILAVSRSLLEPLQQAGLVRPSGDPEAQVLLAMLSGLLPVLLPRHIERHLGLSLRSDAGVERWTRAEYELLTGGILRPPPGDAPAHTMTVADGDAAGVAGIDGVAPAGRPGRRAGAR